MYNSNFAFILPVRDTQCISMAKHIHHLKLSFLPVLSPIYSAFSITKPTKTGPYLT